MNTANCNNCKEILIKYCFFKKLRKSQYFSPFYCFYLLQTMTPIVNCGVVLVNHSLMMSFFCVNVSPVVFRFQNTEKYTVWVILHFSRFRMRQIRRFLICRMIFGLLTILFLVQVVLRLLNGEYLLTMILEWTIMLMNLET